MPPLWPVGRHLEAGQGCRGHCPPSPTVSVRIKEAQQARASKRTARALDLLRRALAHGYADYGTMQTDVDLDDLRRTRLSWRCCCQRGHLERRYAAVWQASGTRESAESHGLEALRMCSVQRVGGQGLSAGVAGRHGGRWC